MHIVNAHKKTCCDKCGMCFNNKFNLKQHFLTKHSKSMNYLCEKCPKEYTRKEHLKKHEETCNVNSKNSISKTNSVLLWMMDGEEVNMNIEINENDFEKDIEKLVGNVDNILIVEDVHENVLDCLIDESVSLCVIKDSVNLAGPNSRKGSVNYMCKINN